MIRLFYPLQASFLYCPHNMGRFTPAYQIAALKPEEQQMLVTTIDYEQATPSLSQAQRMKKFS